MNDLRKALYEWQTLKRKIDAAWADGDPVEAERLEGREQDQLVAVAESGLSLLQDLYEEREKLRRVVERWERRGWIDGLTLEARDMLEVLA